MRLGMESSSEGECEGRLLMARVTAVLPNCLYSLVLEDGKPVTAHIASEMRLHNVRLLEGDRVKVELSMLDPSRGRIVRRVREGR